MANHQTLVSTSASAIRNINCSYDVFINHRGPDVKKTFASHLYRRLLSYGFRVFLDQLELQEGENLNCQIRTAIATASVSVAIFSPIYAESNWCLDELLLMLKSGAIIIPVFYHVKPSELRWTRGKDKTGVYAEALRRLEKKKRYEPNTVEEWREALFSVAELSGLELEACNGDEGELVDRILQLVQKRARKPPLDVAAYRTGLDEKLEDFERTVLSQYHNGEAKIAGIAGAGGVGKTTLAKQFFNLERPYYDRSCFLFEVREAEARSSLTSTQSKLYEALTGRDQVMNSIDEGIAMLKHHVPPCQVLIVLDDVDSAEQLRALFSPLKDTPSSLSLILVTSRNKTLLKTVMKESSIYSLAGLNREDSLKLFCLHAFHQPYPVLGFEEVVNKFLDACHGLPLSLKVIGALLYSESQDLEYWKSQLLKISKVLPTDIQGRLKISYDSLDEEEREIFLDIACFFVGEDKEKAIKIWDGSNWEGSIGFKNLHNKYLVEVDRKNCIRMHDHIRDMGRALAEKEPRRRLWHLTDDIFYNVFHQSYVRGLNIQTSAIPWKNHLEISSPFVDLRGVQLLRVEGEWCESISNLLRRSNLLWLRWDFSSFNPISEHGSKIVSSSHGYSESVSEIVSSSSLGFLEVSSLDRPCRYSSLLSCIPLKELRKNLRVLEVFGHEIQLETLWESDSEAPVKLRELNIDVALLQLPKSIGKLKHLEKIELGYTITTLPEEFFHLPSLKHLRLRASMKSLPDAFGSLTNLQHVNLTGCCDLKMLPNSFGNLTNLQYLNLYGCSRLETLPHSFGNLIQLKHLYLKSCSELTLSSVTFGNIITLESLDLSDCQKMEVLPPQVTHQWSMERLLLWNTKFKELPSDIGNLSNLEILRVSFEESSMEMLPPSLGKLKSLKQLTLFGGKWKCLPDSVAELKQLTDLTIDCGGIEYLPTGVRELNNLKILKITRCPLVEVPFSIVENVGGKDASAYQSGRRLSDSSVHKCVLLRFKQLDLHGTRIKELSFVEGVCPNLRQLDISDCLELVEVGELPTTLILLDLNGCDALKKITGICGLAKLRELDMRKCEAVEELPGLETLTSLVHLRVSGCRRLQSITGLARSTNLRTPSALSLSLEASHSDDIEWKLFDDLKLWKVKLATQEGEAFMGENKPQVAEDFEGGNKQQLEAEDFEGGNKQQLEGEDFKRGKEKQLETKGFMGENELQVEAEDFGLGNELQLEGEDFNWGNDLRLGDEVDFRRGRGNALRLEAEDFRSGNKKQKQLNELQSESEVSSWGKFLRLGAEVDSRRGQGNALLLKAENHFRRGNRLRTKAEDLLRRGAALRLEAARLLEADDFANEGSNPRSIEDPGDENCKRGFGGKGGLILKSLLWCVETRVPGQVSRGCRFVCCRVFFEPCVLMSFDPYFNVAHLC